MSRRLSHPLWVHAPALIVWAAFGVYSLIGMHRWPARTALQFGLDGQPSRYGATGLVISLILVLGAVLIAIGILVDDLWARQEAGKRFNLFSLLDEVIVGFMVGTQVGMLEAAASGRSGFSFPWGYVGVIAGGTVILGLLLELVRPVGSATPAVPVSDMPSMRRRLELAKARGETIAYWDVQNPRYVSILSLGIPVLLWAPIAWHPPTSPWTSALLIGLGAFLLLLLGGQRTRVDGAGVSIRYGFAGIRVLRIPLDNIVSAQVRSFSPLRDFGGYGIRRNRTTWGYFLRGDRGVGITTTSGRDILIGSDQPERLAAAVQAMSGCRRREEGRDVE